MFERKICWKIWREVLEYENVGEFLADIKREFGGGDEELVKVTELKKLEQGGKTM